MTILNKNYNGEGTPDIEVMSGSIGTQSKTNQRILHIQQSELVPIIEQLSLCANKDRFRELQREGMNAIVDSMKSGKTSGVIKLPTGTGKTRLFCELLRTIGKNGLILVPRVDLYDSTVRDLIEAGFDKEKDIHLLHEQEGGNTADKLTGLLTDPQIHWNSGKNQCIMTYQALTSLVSKNPQMPGFIQSHFDVVIEDEAHRGLGDKTKEAIGEIAHNSIDQLYDSSESSELDVEEINELSIEEEAEKIISGIKYNYKFTATPDLLGKSVAEDGEYIYYATVEDAVRSGAIVLPQYVDIGAAYTKNANLDSWKISDIEKLSEGDNFVDESGKSIRDTVIDAYIEKKNEVGGVLPGVAFASTIKHAKDIVAAYEKKGIRAQRVTSDTRDISSKEATVMMDQGELDVIVTVTKVSEGFDYPPLGCAMWFCPSLSPAKIFQGNGRIMRVTAKKKTHTVADHDGKIIPSPGAFIIAPSVWYGGSSEGKKEIDDIGINNADDGELLDEILDEDDGRERKPALPRIGNFYELLIERGEFDINSLGGSLREMIDPKSSIRCELGEEKDVDGVIYIGVTRANKVLGMKGNTILNNLKKADGVTGISARQKNGSNITLVPKSFIESLINTCAPGEEKEVDGVTYMRVTQKNEVLGVKGNTILRNLIKADGVKSIVVEQKNGKAITLVPKSFIESLTNTCAPGEEKEVDGVIYVGVTRTNVVLEMTGNTILRNLMKADGVKSIGVKQKNGKAITLVPKSFIESLINTCAPGEEKEVDGVTYMRVTQENKVLGVIGQTILRNLIKADGVKSRVVKQKNGKAITLVPKSFIESFINTYVPGEEKEVDGVIYVGVTNANEVLGVKGQTILNNLKNADSVKSRVVKQKNGKAITLVPKSFIESLINTCAPGEEKEVDGVIYVGVTNANEVLGVKGKTILRNLIKADGVTGISARQKNGSNITLVPKNFIGGLKK